MSIVLSPMAQLRAGVSSFLILLTISGLWSQPPASVSAVEQNNVGVAYMSQYLYTEAAAAFRKAVAADPDFLLAQINLGIALLYKQDYDEAQAVLERALKRDAKNAYAHFALGLIYKNQGEHEKAEAHFLRVTALDPRDAASFYNLGVMRSRLRKNAEAEAALRRCLEIEPRNTSALYNLGSLLLKTGRAEEGNTMLDRFRALQQQGEAGGGMGIGNQYGEMGTYALAMDYKPAFTPAAISPRPANSRAPFTDATLRSALSGTTGLAINPRVLPRTVGRSEWSREFLSTSLLPDLGGGASLADLDNDSDIDVVMTRFDGSAKKWITILLINDGKARFTEVGEISGVSNSGGHISAALGDYDNDGLVDIYLVGLDGNRLLRNLGQNKFENVTSTAGVADSGLCSSATFVDYDHDGDLDLYVCHYADVSRVPAGDAFKFPDSFPGEPDRMFRNNGNGTFTDFTQTLGIGGGPHRSVGMIPTDFDNDRDIDLIVAREGAAPALFSNERNDRFREIALSAGAPMFRNLTVFDFNRDGSMDFFFSGPAAQRNLLLENRGDGSLREDTRSEGLSRALMAGPRGSTGALDFDNDGDLDLYLLGWNGPDVGSLWENAGDGRFVFAGLLGAGGSRGAAAGDLNGDGRVDIFYLDAANGPRVLLNETMNAKNWIGVQLEGLRSNRMGLGCKLEVRAGALYQKIEVQGHKGYLSQDSPVIWIGLDGAAKADSITVRWPSGILQAEINAPAGKIVRVKEVDRKGTSCPLLYTWNGREFEFVTDFLGGSAYGYLVAPGKYNVPDTDEYVRIEGRQLVPRHGRYLLNLNNQLEEIIMFDRTELLVVDHPPGTEIYPNERLMPSLPFPEFKIHTTSGARIPMSAVDERGRDVLSRVARLDREYPSEFRSLPFKGYAEMHAITLDLGDLRRAHKALLLMDAWIDYADSSSNLAASQAGVMLAPPFLQVINARGEWQTVIPSMGFPAGLPKTMTVDLTGKFLTSDFRVRIVTNMKIYWDRIRIDTSRPEEVRVTRLKPVSAELRFQGYPLYYSPDGKQPWIYDYNRLRMAETWGTHAGAYTRFGDVKELLLASDDKYVVTRHGDEVRIGFDARIVPPLPMGWVRDYLLYADGFGKDMDMNSLYPEAMGPLPFHGMSGYPYSATERYPDDEAHRSYRRTYNTRIFPVPPARPLTTAQ